MSANPQPRPALRKSPDHSVHPAAPRLTPILAELPRLPIENPAASPGEHKKGKRRPKAEASKSGGKPESPADGPTKTIDPKSVDLVVPLPKSLRKRVRAKAAEHGMTAEEAAYQLLRAWAGE